MDGKIDRLKWAGPSGPEGVVSFQAEPTDGTPSPLVAAPSWVGAGVGAVPQWVWWSSPEPEPD